MEKTERETGLGRITTEQIEKVESNDSPEIPDRGEASEVPGLPLGVLPQEETLSCRTN